MAHIGNRLSGFPAAWLIVAFSVFFASCNGGDGSPGDTIKIGVLAPFNTQPGEGIRNGVALAVKEINDAGGIDGKRIEVVEVNTEYSSEKAVRGYQRLAGKDGVVAVLGVCGDGIFPIQEQLSRYRIPMITTGTGSDALTDKVREDPERYRWFFRVMHKSSELGQVTSEFAINCLSRKHGLHKFAILVEDDIWTNYIRDIWQRDLEADPQCEVVFTGEFSSQTQDFGVVFQQIKKSGAEYILDASSRVDATAYLKRWATVDAPPIGAIPTGAGTQRYYDLLGDAGLYVTSVATLPSHENPLTPKSADWWDHYFTRYGDPAYTSGYSYDAVYILKDAIERAGSTKPDALIAALEKTDLVGCTARWVFGADHHPIYGPKYRQIPVMQYLKPGARGFRVVWPPNRAVEEYHLK